MANISYIKKEHNDICILHIQLPKPNFKKSKYIRFSFIYVPVMTKIDYTKNHFVDINDIFRWYKLISRFNCLWENSRAMI